MSISQNSLGITPVAKLETLERSRRRILVAVVVTTIAWILPQIIQSFAPGRMPRPLHSGLILVGALGGLAYVVAMLRYHRYQRRVLADPDLRRRLDDERVVGLRREAAYRGWITLVVFIAGGVGLASFVELPDKGVLLTLMLIAVNAPILFYLALDKD